MFKKIILISSLLLSSSVFAGQCNDPVKKLDNLSIKELNKVKSELNKSLDDVDFSYHYTLAHNRIYMKTLNIKKEDGIKKIKALRPDNKELSDKLDDFNLISGERSALQLKIINTKTKYISDHQSKIIKSKLAAINKIIKSKKGRESQK